MGKCSPLPRKRPPEQEQAGAPGRWGSAPLCPGNAPQSRSRWEASGSPHLAVIHAGCARAFTAEQRPAPTGARRSGESCGSAGLLDLRLPSERETEAEDSLSHGLPASLADVAPPRSIWKEWGSDSERPRPVGQVTPLCPMPCGRSPERGLCCKTRQAQPRSSRLPAREVILSAGSVPMATAVTSQRAWEDGGVRTEKGTSGYSVTHRHCCGDERGTECPPLTRERKPPPSRGDLPTRCPGVEILAE